MMEERWCGKHTRKTVYGDCIECWVEATDATSGLNNSGVSVVELNDSGLST